jgi:hypothetical protein
MTLPFLCEALRHYNMPNPGAQYKAGQAVQGGETMINEDLQQVTSEVLHPEDQTVMAWGRV